MAGTTASIATYPAWPAGCGPNMATATSSGSYQVADSLHGNFYEDEFTAEDVAQALGDVESLLDKLDPLIGA